MAAKKKTFAETINPALQFITPRSEEEAPAANSEKTANGKKPRAKAKPSSAQVKGETTAAPKGYKPNPAFIETKSRRLQLLMQPSLHDRIKDKAAAEGLSVNEFIHKTLEEALREG